MKPKFKLLAKYTTWGDDPRWLHWGLVEGNVYSATYPPIYGKVITQGSVVSITADAFWGEKR